MILKKQRVLWKAKHSLPVGVMTDKGFVPVVVTSHGITKHKARVRAYRKALVVLDLFAGRAVKFE